MRAIAQGDNLRGAARQSPLITVLQPSEMNAEQRSSIEGAPVAWAAETHYSLLSAIRTISNSDAHSSNPSGVREPWNYSN